MRKISFVVLGIVGVLILSSVALAVGNGNGNNVNIEKGPKFGVTHAQLQGERFAIDPPTGKVVERRVVYHHKEGHGGGPSGGGPPGNGGGDSSCFGVLGNKVFWKVTEPYVLDTSNSDGMSDAFVSTTTAASFETWDSEVSFDVFGAEDTGSVVDGADTSSPDGKNEVFFGVVDSPGAIGVTIVWGVFNGPPSQRRIVEYDTIFNDPDYVWGDSNSDPSVMDYANIAVHEFGHSAGLDDLYEASCSEETMYGFATEGETSKRSLNDGDIAGINSLYA